MSLNKNNSFFSQEELHEIGFLNFGENVLISKKASIYSPEKIIIGSNVRIDDFCILSGKITLGNFIHISASCLLFAGDAGISFEDFSCMSSRCAVYAINDDYSGHYLTNSMVPDKVRNVTESPVYIEKYSIIGSGCTILPGVTIQEGTAVGCMSLVNRTIGPWKIYAGIPCKMLCNRSMDLQNLVHQL